MSRRSQLNCKDAGSSLASRRRTHERAIVELSAHDNAPGQQAVLPDPLPRLPPQVVPRVNRDAPHSTGDFIVAAAMPGQRPEQGLVILHTDGREPTNAMGSLPHCIARPMAGVKLLLSPEPVA